MALCHSYVNYMLSTDINITETTYFCQFNTYLVINKFKSRLYGVLLTMATTSNDTSEQRIARKYPGIAWQ